MPFQADPIGFPSPQMFSVVAHEATITMHGHIRAREGELYRGLNHNPQPEPETPPTTTHAGGEFIGGDRIASHQIFEFMTRLPFVRGRTVVLWDDLPQVCYDLVSLAGFVIDKAPRAARFNRIRVISCPVGRIESGHIFCYTPALDGLRRLMGCNVNRLGATGSGRRLFCRRRAGHRLVLNEEAVVAALEARGIDCLFLEDLPIAEQILQMQEASLVVMPMGGGSAFTWFVPDDCRVVELSCPGIAGDFGTRVPAVVRGRPWIRLNGAPEGSGRDANYTVAIDDLNRALDAVGG